MAEQTKKRKASFRFTEEQEKQIIIEYQQGSSMRTLGTKYSCSPSTIKNILTRHDIQSRTLSEARRNYLNYTINEDIFENIDTPDKAYWLGVFYSDGYISKANDYTNYFGISVQASDIAWLEKLKQFLNYSGEIKHYLTGEGSFKPGAEYVRLLIGNNKIVADLEKWGVVEHKTKVINKLPDIQYLDDFIRGYNDGDGSLAKRLPHFAISGNKDFLESIAKYFNLPYKLYEDKTIYSLQYNKNCSEYLEKRLYKNATSYLDRKYEIATRSFNSPIILEDIIANPEYQGKSLEL